MITQAGDLGILIDTGTNRPGKLQRLENGMWVDYVKDAKPMCWPIAVEKLEPGRYRVETDDGDSPPTLAT